MMEDGEKRYFDRDGCEYLDYSDSNLYRQEMNKRRLESLGLGEGMGPKPPKKQKKTHAKSTTSRSQTKNPERSQPRRSQVRRFACKPCLHVFPTFVVVTTAALCLSSRVRFPTERTM